jgi:L-fuconolactonase
VEFLVDHGHELDEARYAEKLVRSSPPLRAFVASAPVEQGVAVARELELLAAVPAVRAIRRVPAGGDYAAALGPDLVAGVQAVGKAGWPFEIGVHHASLPAALELVRRCPEVTFVLDHLGTPPIVGSPEPGWCGLMKEFGALHNVRAKLSGLMAGTGAEWRADDVVAHLRVAIECFGPSRVMYGSDWPMFTPVIGYGDWLAMVQQATANLSPDEVRDIFAGVATRTYGLEEAS